MALKKYNPTTPSLRFTTVSAFEEITKSQPERALVRPRKQNAGRNSAGRITVRHRGGGHKRKLRIIDFKRDKAGIPARVAAIEYDPNRSANLALAALCRWREALHTGTGEAEGWRTGVIRGSGRGGMLGMPCLWGASRWVCSCTIWSWSQVAGVRSAGAPVTARN
jgi:hypothetical protein